METVQAIKSLLEEGVEKKHFPGAHFAIIYKNGLVLEEYLGYKELYPNEILNTGNEIYDIASLTKVISTTTMIMKLIEEETLTLHTSVSEVLPNFKYDEIQIHHLLTHSSGLPADIRESYKLKTKKDVISKIYSSELINPVGEKIVYSDIGFMLLGLIIEKITNKSLETFSQEIIFKKLGMTDTSYKPDTKRCAPTELREDEVYTGVLQGKVHDEKSFAMQGLSGHAGLFSTTSDIAKFILSILRNDEQVLKKDTVDSLFVLRKRQVRTGQVPLVRSYGFDKPTLGGTAGDFVDFGETIVHTGFTGCNLWIDRKHGVGFVLLSNAIHPKRGLNKIIQYRNRIGNMVITKKEEENND